MHVGGRGLCFRAAIGGWDRFMWGGGVKVYAWGSRDVSLGGHWGFRMMRNPRCIVLGPQMMLGDGSRDVV